MSYDTSMHHNGNVHSSHLSIETAHRIEALIDQENTYDLAAAVHDKGRALLLQLVNYLVVSVALGFQVDINNSTSQLAIISLVVIGYMLSDVITNSMNAMLHVDGFSRSQLAVFVQFCTSTPLSFVGYVAVNIVRDNVIPSDSTPSLEVIIPISVLLCWAYVEFLFQDSRASQTDAAYVQIRREEALAKASQSLV